MHTAQELFSLLVHDPAKGLEAAGRRVDTSAPAHSFGDDVRQRGRALERDPTNPVCNCNFATVLMEKMETVDAAVPLWAQWAVVFGAVVFALCFHAEYHCCFML